MNKKTVLGIIGIFSLFILAFLLADSQDPGGLFRTPTPTVTNTATSTATNTATPTNIPIPSNGQIRFAVIGDYGNAGQRELDVSNLVKSWNPDFIITTGDNNYPSGEADTIDENIGQYYHDFIGYYTGTHGTGSAENKFFPSLGNHDWRTINAQPYLDYFTLPGNERYYDYLKGPIHFFVVDSNSDTPGGVTSTSVQGTWLKNQLAASTSQWNVVYFHHAPYSSSTNHGSTKHMQWPFKLWGADVVLSGHDHSYERLTIDGVTYFVNGAGGANLYVMGEPISGSQARYDVDYGAMLVEANSNVMDFKFINRLRVVIDSYSLTVNPITIEATP
jgi:tartrate-resistant acid phosphatase type 5